MSDLIIPVQPQNKLAEQAMTILPAVRGVCPPGFAAEQFCCALISEINRLDPAVEFRSVALCCFNAAVVGLIPGEALGHCHLVPFKRNKGKRNEITQAQLVIGYKGFLELSFGNNFLAAAQVEVVLQDEYDRGDFELTRTETGPKLRHPIRLGRNKRYENVAAAYCSYQTKAGGEDVVIVERDELDELAKRWSYNGLPLIPMCLKTPVRRASKMWRLTSRMALAVQLDELAERDESQDIGAMPERIDYNRPPSLKDLDDDQRSEPAASA